MNTQVIGYVGENGTRDVQIPVGHLLEQWPELSPSILMVPVGGADDDAYPVDSELIGSDLVWHVSAADTAAIGTTKASVRMTASDGRVALDEPFTVIVSQNLSAGGTPPSPIQPWVDRLAELTTKAEKAADDAAEAADRANDAAQNWEDGTAANASLLANKPPEYYLTPVNLLDNSNFRNPVNQREQRTYTRAEYCIDRWIIYGFEPSSSIEMNVSNGYITLGENTYLQHRFQLGLYDINKTYTTAIWYLDGGISVSQIDIGRLEGSFDYVNIFPEQNRGVIALALYEGQYTAETLPPYVPKPYAAELAECQRYYLPIVLTPMGYGYIFNNLAVINVQLPQPMRAVPTIPDGVTFYIIQPNGVTLTSTSAFISSMSGNGLQINVAVNDGVVNTPVVVFTDNLALNLEL